MNFKNYYKILGLDKNTAESEIKKAYRKLAKQWHPDKNPGNKKAENKFKEISEAYDVLSDNIKRKKFDDFINVNESKAAYSYNNAKHYYTNTSETDFSDFFKQFFKKRSKQKYSYFKGDDLRGKITIELQEAYTGSMRIINTSKEKIRIKIKPGITNDKILKIKGKGKASKYGGENGDLFIRIVINKNDLYTRRKNDLIKKEIIDVYTAILGGEISVSTFKGNIKVKIPPNFKFNKKLRVREYGMPDYDNPNKFGDLHLDLDYKLPETISEEEQILLRRIQEIRDSL